MRNPIILLCLFILVGCQTTDKNEVLKLQSNKVISIPSPTPLAANSLIEDFDTIRLEATNKSLLSSIRQVRLLNDKFYITDDTKSFVFIFSHNGKFISNICNQGEGPKEYIQISNMQVNPYNSHIYITDAFSRRLFEYDENGQQLKFIQLDFHPTCFMSDQSFRRIHLNSGGKIIDATRSETNNKHNIIICNEEGEITNSFLKDETPKPLNISETSASGYTEEGNLLYMPILSDVIYRINENQAVPEYLLVSKHKNMLSEEDKKDIFYTFDKNNVIDYENKNYLMSFGSFLKSDSLMMFSFGWENKWRTFYSLQKKKSFTISPDNLSGNKGLCEIFSNFPQFIQGDTFYIAVDPMQISYALPLLPEGKLKTFFESFTEDDNPCIIAYRINKKLFDVEK